MEIKDIKTDYKQASYIKGADVYINVQEAKFLFLALPAIQEKLSRIGASIAANNSNNDFVSCDMIDMEQVQDLINKIKQVLEPAVNPIVIPGMDIFSFDPTAPEESINLKKKKPTVTTHYDDENSGYGAKSARVD